MILKKKIETWPSIIEVLVSQNDKEELIDEWKQFSIVLQNMYDELVAKRYKVTHQNWLDSTHEKIAELLKTMKKAKQKRKETGEVVLKKERNLTQGVQIMTIHKAKGLEFDHVFLPTICDENFKGKNKPSYFNFHFQGEEYFSTNILSKSNNEEMFSDVKSLSEREEKSEKMRLIYVALTRAKKNNRPMELYIADEGQCINGESYSEHLFLLSSL